MLFDFNLVECTLPFRETQHPHGRRAAIIQFIRYGVREKTFYDDNFICGRLEIIVLGDSFEEVCSFGYRSRWLRLQVTPTMFFHFPISISRPFDSQLSNLWNEKPIKIQFSSHTIFVLGRIEPPKIESTNMVKWSRKFRNLCELPEPSWAGGGLRVKWKLHCKRGANMMSPARNASFLFGPVWG